MLRSSLARNRRILLTTARGLATGVVRRREELRHHVVRDAWTVAKRFAAGSVQNIERREVPIFVDAVVEGYAEDHQGMLVAALARGLNARSFFEIGTNRGRTAWTVARNNPEAHVYTLDVPLELSSSEVALDMGTDDHHFFRPGAACGEAFAGTPEAERITQLWGDSATFDYAPYAGRIDMVYVDGGHSYEYVRSDTVNALAMLSPTGTIVWDDYGSHPDIYLYVNELAPTLDRPVYHVFASRMAIYSRQDFVVRRAYDGHASLPV